MSPVFIDSLKAVNGKFIHPELHSRRIRYTQQVTFGHFSPFELTDALIPQEKRQGIKKCRITYGQKIQKIEFEDYCPRQIHTLKPVDGSSLDYHLKYADRRGIDRLFQQRGNCDDILIVQHGFITDSSYSNLVFFDGREYVTPDTYLLNGTRRQQLLEQGIIREKPVRIYDLPAFRCVYLINAMLDLCDRICVDITDICTDHAIQSPSDLLPEP